MKNKLFILILLLAAPVMADQQTLDRSTTLPANFTHGDYRSLMDDNVDKSNTNVTELYRLAHDSYSSLQEYDDGDIVTSGHILYVSLQDSNTGHAVTDAAWWQEVQTGGGSALEVQDESISLDSAVTKLNFLGSGVSAVENADHEIDITVAGGSAPVDSVFGRTGAVTAQAGDYSAYYLALATCSTAGEVPTWNGSAFTCSTPTGSGDMTKATYDTGDNGIVDNAEALLGGTWAAPGAIGVTTPAAVTGTTATFDTYQTSATDGNRYQLIWNTNDPSITCDAAHNGAFAYRRSDNSFRYCNGSAWGAWPGGSGSPANIVDTDPTSSSPTGEYWSRASGDLFYVVNDGGASDGIFQVAGTWTPDAVTYSLTVDMVDGNGIDKFTYLTTDYTTDQTFTGLTADSTFTVTADTGRIVSCTGTGLTDNGSGSYTANTDSENVAATCTYSASSGTVANDTFTDTDTALLTTHASDSGHTWTKVGTGGDLVFDSNKIHADTSGGFTSYYSSYVPIDADYTVQAIVYSSATGGATPFICGRLDTSLRTGYCVNYLNGDWNLRQWVDGSVALLASYTGDEATTARTVQLVITDAAKQVIIDGVTRINYTTDNTISAAGRPGVGTYYSDNSALRNLDDWQVTE